ncbi:MAG: BBP7 family outer membrane beta-barrel protein, partial [Gemmataceae bacterium]|nr:BBP7 family outer membrane beta-barrel protein [Gemmataceae bacterium]
MRKGILASLAMVLGQTAAQAQYWPAQQPVYYPAPHQGAAWVAPPGYQMPQHLARPAYPAPVPNFLPQSYFPAQQPPHQPVPQRTAAQAAPDQAAKSSTATPVPPEPIGAPLPPAPVVVEPLPRATVRHSNFGGPASFGLEVVPAALPEPVVFHRTPNDKWWLSGDYLRGWITPGPLSTPLLTLGSTNQISPGNLAEDGTVILFGNRDLDFRMLSGFRTEMGMFLDEECRFSIDLSGFYFMPARVKYRISSDPNGMPVISIPVFATDGTGEAIYEVSDPVNLVTGKSNIDARTQIWGLETNGRWHAYCKRRLHTEVL